MKFYATSVKFATEFSNQDHITMEPLLSGWSGTYYHPYLRNFHNHYCYQLVPCSLMSRGGSHYRAFMVTPLGCKNVLSPRNQVVVIISRITTKQVNSL